MIIEYTLCVILSYLIDNKKTLTKQMSQNYINATTISFLKLQKCPFLPFFYNLLKTVDQHLLEVIRKIIFLNYVHLTEE